MSFNTDLYDDTLASVLTLVNRPDIQDEIEMHFKTATTSAHLSDKYPRDLVVKPIMLPNQVAAYTSALDITNSLPRIRDISSIRALDSTGAPLETPRIEVVEIDDIYDNQYNTIKNDIAYLGGRTLNIRTSVGAYGFLVEYYEAPNLARERYDSWIAQLNPALIIYWAAFLTWNGNGNEERANRTMKIIHGDPRNGVDGLLAELRANYAFSKAR